MVPVIIVVCGEAGGKARRVSAFCAPIAAAAVEPSKIVRRCSYPLTAVGATRRVYTNLATLDISPSGFVVVDMAPGLTFENLQARTDAPLRMAG